MSLLLIGDSNVERIWLHVKENREHLRSATFVPVKRVDQLPTGFQAITASVSLDSYLNVKYVLFCFNLITEALSNGLTFHFFIIIFVRVAFFLVIQCICSMYIATLIRFIFQVEYVKIFV